MPGNATGDALSPGTPFTPQQTHRTPSQSQSALHSRLQTQPQPQAQGSSGQGRDLGAATEAEIGECFDAFLRDSESGEEEDGARGWGRGQGQGEHTQGVLERLTAAGAFDGSRSGAENAFARYSASVVDALPKRGGGGAGGGGGGSSGVVDEQLLRKRALHSRFLRFLRHTQCWGHLLQTQRQCPQLRALAYAHCRIMPYSDALLGPLHADALQNGEGAHAHHFYVAERNASRVWLSIACA